MNHILTLDNRVTLLAILSMLALLMAATAIPAFADTMQSISANPEVPAGNTPQPNGNGNNGANGTPQSISAVPEVPAGANPQPN